FDRRSGQPASSATPRAEIRETLYEVWPPEYRAWMAANDLPMPPAALSVPGEAEAPRLVITFPKEGDILRIDPVLRREFQTILLEAVVPEGISEVEWMIGDSTLARLHAPYRLRWPLTPGSHRLVVRGRGRNGTVSSDPVTFRVL
ncbi:MAG TPA: hypothetical protein PKJ13_04920, partial [bacterium]|nr:hypothetical protein [bacterium]